MECLLLVNGIWEAKNPCFVSILRNCASRFCWLMEFLREVNQKDEWDIFSMYMNICMAIN